MNIYSEMVNLIKSALHAAVEAHRYVFLPSDDPVLKLRLESGAVATALRGFSLIQSAKSLYVVSGQDNDLLIDVFHRYESFVREITQSFAVDHGHQWTDAEFSQLLNLVKDTELEISLPEDLVS